jgi:hypothetical protein
MRLLCIDQLNSQGIAEIQHNKVMMTGLPGVSGEILGLGSCLDMQGCCVISFPRSRVGTHTAASSLTCCTDDRQIGIPTLERGNEKSDDDWVTRRFG